MLACKYAVLETRWPRVRKEADPVSTGETQGSRLRVEKFHKI